MIWADKFSLWLFTALFLLFVFMAMPTAKDESFIRLFFGAIGFVSPIWVLLRVIDWLSGGAERRNKHWVRTAAHQVIDVTPYQ